MIIGDKKDCRVTHNGKLDLLFHSREDISDNFDGFIFVAGMDSTCFSACSGSQKGGYFR